MSKPLATLGEALTAKGADIDWRAAARAEGIARRPPPSSASSRPDRGYVEQPEERREETTTQLPKMRRRVETPSLDAPVALIRFERTASYPPPDAPPSNDAPAPTQEAAPPFALVETEPATFTLVESKPPAPEVSDVPAAKKHKWGGRGNPAPSDFRAQVIAAAREARDSTPPGLQSEVAARFGVSKSAISSWLKAADDEDRKNAIVAKRKATREANQANGASTERVQREVTQVSRASSGVASRPRGNRSFETVSLELAGALAKVSELKRELRDLLDE